MNLPSLQAVHVLVVGDLMLDRYVCGSVSRISPEAPVPVVQVMSDNAVPGGAANVALNIQARDGAQQRGFATARGAEKTDELAVEYVEGDIT